MKSHLGLILTVLMTILFFSNDFGLIDIQKTAIVVAMGIDKTQNCYHVSAQIAIPQATDSGSGGNDSVVTGKGKTVAEAVDDIGTKTGWYPKLVFCNIILLGKDATSQNVMKELDFFLRTDKVQNTCLIAATEERAEDVLTAVSPLDQISSFALQKILLKDAAKTGEIAVSNLKDFSLGYFSRAKTGFMPYVKKIPMQGEGKEKGGGSGGDGGSGGGQNSAPQKTPLFASQGEAGGGEKAKETFVFDATETLLFLDGKAVCLLSADQTRAFNFVRKKVTDAVIELENAEYNGRSVRLLLALEKNKYSTKLTFDGNVPVFEMKASFRAKLVDVDGESSLEEISTPEVVPDAVLWEAERKVEEMLVSVFTFATENGCDLFRLNDKLFRHHPKKYDAFSKSILDKVQLKTTVKMTSSK